ncbi:ABC-three component system middle component 5 [Agrobacterium cavarae]|uniref:ABC-three component system middle component 5 n=1 Tax=Agrobacterium cavarae TaxID=2528239 RepID=UPI0028AF6422|nr:ABC-three component system middle component 5 [Agrobacterium cavarae]
MYISYSAAQDPFHAVFRFFCLLDGINISAQELQRLLLYDFFVCFPWMVSDIEGVSKIPGFIKELNRTRRAYRRNSYEQIPEKRIMFKRMRPAQMAALNSLCSYGYLSPADFEGERVVRTAKEIPSSINLNVRSHVAANAVLFGFIKNFLHELPITGALGLKAKTGLEEFRYDYIPT